MNVSVRIVACMRDTIQYFDCGRLLTILVSTGIPEVNVIVVKRAATDASTYHFDSLFLSVFFSGFGDAE